MINKRTQPGFTIVELLIVVVLIAILAAITIVAYNGLQKRAQTAAVSTALNQAAKKVRMYEVDNSTLPASLATAGINDNDVTYQYTTAANTYCITGTQGNTSLYVSTTQASPTAGGCAGHGQGGVAAVTNIVPDPRATGYNVAGGPTWESGRFGGSGTYSTLTGQASPAGTNLTTAVRFTNTITGPSRGFHISGNPENPTPGADPMTRLLVTPGEVYAISCWMRTSQSGLSFNLKVRPALDANTWIDAGVSGAGVAASPGVWIKISQKYTVPAGAAALSVYAIVSYPSNVDVGTTVDGTGLMVVKGTTASNYADGSTPNWVWNGAANASTSTGPAL